MSLMTAVRAQIGDQLFRHTARRHKSRLFYLEARQFTRHLKYCQSVAPVRPTLVSPLSEAVNDFNETGFAAFSTAETTSLAKSLLAKIKTEESATQDIWDANGRYISGEPFSKFPEFVELFEGAIGTFICGVFSTRYAIHASALYKSVRKHDEPEGSQIWHADGGPGTCINVMFCLTETSKENGAMKCLPWKYSLEIFQKERAVVRRRTVHALDEHKVLSREQRRSIISNFYRDQIESSYADKVGQPVGQPGLVYAFRNTCIHAGGYPEPGHERIVCVTHVYPSTKNNLAWCRSNGTKEYSSYPKSPSSLGGIN